MTCKASLAQTIRLDTTEMSVGDKRAILVHPACKCATGCRRVALFSSLPPLDATTDYVVKLIARVRFGDDCDGGEVEVDWKRGVILDLLGCYTAVDVELVEKEGTTSFPTFSLTALSACCGAGGARGEATRTYGVQTLQPEETSTAVPIPPFAYALRGVPRVQSDGSLNAVFFGGAGIGVVAIYPVTFDTIPIPAGAYYVQFTNVGTEAVAFEPQFLIGV